MDMFQQAGEAMLLAQDGQKQIALAAAARIGSWFSKLKVWHATMPGTLPPTEYQPR